MKSRTTATVLAFFLGWLGIHNFYLGKKMKGVLCLLFFWTYIPFILAIIDGIKLLVMRDEDFSSKYNPIPVHAASRIEKKTHPIEYASNPEAEEIIKKARKEADEIRKEAKKYYQKKVAEADEIANDPEAYIEQQYIKGEQEQKEKIEKMEQEKDREIDRERRKREGLEQKLRKEELKREQEEREQEEQKKKEEKVAKKRAKEIKLIEENIEHHLQFIRSRKYNIRDCNRRPSKSIQHNIDGYRRDIVNSERKIEEFRKQIEKIKNSK